MLLQHGKSYLWLFGVFAVCLIGGMALSTAAAGNPRWAILAMPVLIVFILVSELRSEVALDSWWRATHPKGGWQYNAILGWHVATILFFSWFAYFFISR